MRTCYFMAFGVLLCTVASLPARADTDITGRWVGQFNGVQIEFPAQAGPFGYQAGQPRRSGDPDFVEKTLRLEIESQKQGLAVGNWAAAEFKKKFVCAQLSDTLWNCVDSGGRSTIQVISATEIKVCYLDNREGAQGAGCGVLKKSS